MAIYSGRTGVLISANDRQNTRLDRLIIPRCRTIIASGLCVSARDDDAHYLGSSRFITRIMMSEYAARWNTDGQSPRIDFPRDDFCGTVLKSLFIAGEERPVLPIRIFALSQGSEIFICPRDRDSKCDHSFDHLSASYGPSIIFQTIEGFQLSSSHRRQGRRNGCNFNRGHVGAGIAIHQTYSQIY